LAQCPNCHKSVEILDKHLGTLFTCPQCNAVFFIDWNGQPELANHEVEIEAPVEEAFVPPIETSTLSYETPIEPTIVGDIPENIPEEMAPQEEPYLAPAEEIPPGSEFQTPQSYDQDQQYQQAQQFDAPMEDYQNPPQSPQENAVQAYSGGLSAPASEAEPEIDNYDFNQALGQSPPQPMQSLTSDSSDFSDVTDFGNANAAAGPLSYMVIIDGIETSHLLKQLREAMTDSRFGWDVQSILAKMAGGRLILTGLSPAKASVLINRIKYLPFKISWRQDVLSSS
jgi:hypothetical protein